MGGANSAVYDAERCGPSYLRAAAEEQARPAAVRQGLPKSSQPVPTTDERGSCLRRRDGNSTTLAVFCMRFLKRYYCRINVEVNSLDNIMALLYMYAKGPTAATWLFTAMAAPQRLAPRPARPQVPQVPLPPLPPPPPLPRLLPPPLPQLH